MGSSTASPVTVADPIREKTNHDQTGPLPGSSFGLARADLEPGSGLLLWGLHLL
uniref:Uncharacterized protein n=1 Tax=Rhizophora mucronata TaxID=61149 RepID=A0A2P2PWG2_RHIMU